MRAMKSKKAKPPKVDGLSPKDLQKIRNAIRQVWHRSHPRKLCVARSIGPEGFPVCEMCKAKVPKVHIDHIEPVGDLLHGGIKRMFTPSKNLQALCTKCHNDKTKVERKVAARKRRMVKMADFF